MCAFREDSKAPESRPSSRHSSLRSVLGYRTHAGLAYSSVQNNKPGDRESARNMVYTGAAKSSANGTPQPSNGSGNLPRLNYDHEYGYPV